MEEHPVIVIGAGTAGTQTARALGRANRSVVVVEQGLAGGTCLWHGCVPKKALYAAAGLLRRLHGAEAMGIGPFDDAGSVRGPGPHELGADPSGEGGAQGLDWARTRVWQAEVMRTYAGDQEGILRDLGVEVAHGSGRFVTPDTVEVAGERQRAAHVVVATGSRPISPDLAGGELMDTSDDALFYDELPTSLVVTGGGYIAMEQAAIYKAFGARVHLLVRGERVLKSFDPECAKVALDGLRELGVDVHLHTAVHELRGARGALAVVAVDREGREHIFAAERALAATGRRAALDGLDLAAGGVEVDGEGRPLLDADLRSVSNPRVWFAGDAAGGAQLTPVAGHEGRRAAQAILEAEASAAAGPAARTVPARPDGSPPPVIPSTCFTAPEVARVGLLESELAARGAPYRVARGGFEYTAQAIIRGDRRGLVKLLFDDGDRLVGAHLAGPSAGELVYGLALAVQTGATVTDMQGARAVHPTLAEAISWAASSPETVVPAPSAPD